METSRLRSVWMSRTSGIFSRMTGSSVRMAAAIAGSAAFLAPLMRMLPTSGFPPRITNLSISVCWATPAFGSRFPSRKPIEILLTLRRRRSEHFKSDAGEGLSDIAVDFFESLFCLRPAGSCLEHDQRDRHLATGGFEGLGRGLPVYPGCLLQDAEAALDQLLVGRTDIDHQIAIDVSEPGHGAGAQHVQHHLLRGPGLQARGTGEGLRANLGNNLD